MDRSLEPQARRLFFLPRQELRVFKALQDCFSFSLLFVLDQVESASFASPSGLATTPPPPSLL